MTTDLLHQMSLIRHVTLSKLSNQTVLAALAAIKK